MEDVLSLCKRDMHRLPALPSIAKRGRRGKPGCKDGGRRHVLRMTLPPAAETREVNAFAAKVKDTLTSRPDLSGHPVKVNDVMYPPKILI